MKKSKECTKCKVTKPLSEFHVRPAGKLGRVSRCKCCVKAKETHKRRHLKDYTRAQNLMTRFRLSIDDYNKMFLKQKGVCQICKKAETSKDKNGKDKWLSVDHSHSTGDVRGLLCSKCNTGIGLLGDSKKILKSALKYLKERGSYGES